MCHEATQVHLTHCVVREILATNTRREATSGGVNLFREMCNVFNSVVTKFLHLSPGGLSTRILVSMKIPSCFRE